ncbi:transcriptional regulator [Bradyrhizobium paxllaeri]|uniref:transcriptional regulator n=1 Tax=Bradyrhizobium paxllaeri TaxID=190148 RepID=UPI0008104B70|nr:transcriptional regulator [Bradyrhizobium paxllaeri]
MDTLIVSMEGHIFLSEDLLKHLGVQPGLQVTIEKLPGHRIAIKAFRPKGKTSDVFGFLSREDNPSLSVDEINEAAALGWASKRKR